MNKIKSIIVILTVFFTLILGARAANAEDQSFSLLAGVGLTNSYINPSQGSPATTGFSNKGFLMAFEYSHDFMIGTDALPLSWSGMFVTDDAFLFGLGVDILPFLKVQAKFGYGIANTTQSPNTSPGYPDGSVNYGALYGAAVEIKLAPTFGLSGDYVSNGTYMGGLTFHW